MDCLLSVSPVLTVSGCGCVEHQAVQWLSGVPHASTLRLAFHKRRGRERVEGANPGTVLLMRCTFIPVAVSFCFLTLLYQGLAPRNERGQNCDKK